MMASLRPQQRELRKLPPSSSSFLIHFVLLYLLCPDKTLAATSDTTRSPVLHHALRPVREGHSMTFTPPSLLSSSRHPCRKNAASPFSNSADPTSISLEQKKEETVPVAMAVAVAPTTLRPAEISERVGFKDVEIHLPDAFTPLERIALSAEGDLQRIISSYYNSAVSVDIKHCTEMEPGIFDREVDLSVKGKVFCTAKSSLSSKTTECARLLREKSVGLGQLFRYLRIYPTFRLLDVGRNDDNAGFWRLYELDCPEVLNCRILETFAPDTFHRESKTLIK